MEKQTTPKNLNEQINNPKYIPAGGMPEISEHEKKEIDKQKKELDKLKDNITKK